MANVKVGALEFSVREGQQGSWDRGIIDEVVQRDCYRISSWSPTNPTKILDIGAHIGSFSKWTATRLPNAQVWSFEMMPENFAILSKNTAMLPNVRATNAALGDRSGTIQISALGENTGGNAVNWNSSGDVPSIDVADVLAEWSYIDCLKMDCEGSEFPILRRIAALPGGVQAHVGCVRAEVHGPRNSSDRLEFMKTLSESFPYTSESWTGPATSLAFGWR
jgi:FkbM family methyltransferase